MRLLCSVRCRQCGEPLDVPSVGEFRVQCGACGTMNTTSPYRPEGRTRARRPAKPKVTPEVTPEATPEVVVEVTPEVTPEVVVEVTPEVVVEEAPEVVVEEAPEVVVEEAPFPEWNAKMLKADLLKVAEELGLDVNTKSTKKDITNALTDAQAAHES